MPQVPSQTPRPRGIYLLPNLFTTAGLFAGFYSVVAALKGLYDTAAIAIFIAMIADSLDGRVARLTQTQTAFGAEYDSLSDMVAFGVAPALVAYSSALFRFGKLGWLVAFVYTATAALRLARFNTQVGIADKRYFQGLPSPPAAAIVASLVWLSADGFQSLFLSLVIAVFTLGAGLLMVSNIRYSSFKSIDLKNKVPFVAILLLVLIFVGISLDPPPVLFATFACYGMSGPLITLFQLRKRRSSRRRHARH